MTKTRLYVISANMRYNRTRTKHETHSAVLREAPLILQLEQISKSFGGRTLFSNVTLRLEAYDHLALVGPNGAGKTTMLRIITGQEDADSGRIVLAKDARIGYLEQ